MAWFWSTDCLLSAGNVGRDEDSSGSLDPRLELRRSHSYKAFAWLLVSGLLAFRSRMWAGTKTAVVCSTRLNYPSDPGASLRIPLSADSLVPLRT